MQEECSVNNRIKPNEILSTSAAEEDQAITPCWLFDETSDTSYKSAWSTTNELKYTDEVTVKRVYALARDVDRILRDNQITYWTSGGTTLGCIRHGGLIPWDDDLDICIYQEDENNLQNLQSIFESKGYRMCEAQLFGYRIFHESESEHMRSEFLNHRYPFCDVFVMKKSRNKCYIATASGRTLWPKEYYYVKDTEKLEQKPFGDFFLNCPANAEEYLNRYYGLEWFSVGATHNYDHITRQYVNSVKFKLKQCHYQPAKPFS